MPYALFCDDARISQIFPTEASVWRHARDSGLVVDVDPEDRSPSPRSILDNGYEIRACQPEPGDNPARNEAEANAAGGDQLKRDAA